MSMESAASMVLEIPYTERPSVLEVAYGYSTSTGEREQKMILNFYKKEFKSRTDSASVCENDPRSGATSRKHSVTAMQHP